MDPYGRLKPPPQNPPALRSLSDTRTSRRCEPVLKTSAIAGRDIMRSAPIRQKVSPPPTSGPTLDECTAILTAMQQCFSLYPEHEHIVATTTLNIIQKLYGIKEASSAIESITDILREHLDETGNQKIIVIERNIDEKSISEYFLPQHQDDLPFN
jgi:hypothetical protein